MANTLNSNPLVINTDIANYNSTQTLQPTAGAGLQGGYIVTKMALYVGASTSVAGTVTVTDPTTTNPRLTPMLVPGGAQPGTLLFSADFTNEESASLRLSNFAVTGLTASGTVLLLWVR